MAVLFAAPFAIVLVYSLLTRGAYGGVKLPWTMENYPRLLDPLYLTILWRSFVDGPGGHRAVPGAGFPAAMFIRAPSAARICTCAW